MEKLKNLLIVAIFMSVPFLSKAQLLGPHSATFNASTATTPSISPGYISITCWGEKTTFPQQESTENYLFYGGSSYTFSTIGQIFVDHFDIFYHDGFYGTNTATMTLYFSTLNSQTVGTYVIYTLNPYLKYGITKTADGVFTIRMHARPL